MKETLTEAKLTFEVFYPHAPEQIWRALTDPAALKRWLMPTDFRPRLGHKFRFAEPTDARYDQPISCEVVELDAPHRLAYTWQSEHDAAPTLVTWTLEPVEGGTRVHLEHTAPALAATLAFHSEVGLNWTAALRNSLPANLDRSTRLPLGRIDLSAERANLRCVSRQSCVHSGTRASHRSIERAAFPKHPNTQTHNRERAYVSHR